MKRILALITVSFMFISCQKEDDTYSNPELNNTIALIESQNGAIDDEALVADLESSTIVLGRRFYYVNGEPAEYDIIGGSYFRGIKLNNGVMWSNYVPDSDWTDVWGAKMESKYDIKTRVFTYPEFEDKSAKVLYYDGSTIIIDGHLGLRCYDGKNITYLYVGSICKEMPDGWAPFPVE